LLVGVDFSDLMMARTNPLIVACALFLSYLLASTAFSPNRPTLGARRVAHSQKPATSLLTDVTFARRRPDATRLLVDNTSGNENAAVDNSTTAENVLQRKDESSENLMQKVKDAGTAGVISYAVWELGFWAVSVPVVLFGYREVTGHWPDLSDKDDVTKVGAEAFAFVNFARFAVPLRIGLALSTTSWVQANIVDRFMKSKGDLVETKMGPTDTAAIVA
jgi:hypothetical protein